jgi:hypothetical protein
MTSLTLQYEKHLILNSAAGGQSNSGGGGGKKAIIGGTNSMSSGVKKSHRHYDLRRSSGRSSSKYNNNNNNHHEAKVMSNYGSYNFGIVGGEKEYNDDDEDEFGGVGRMTSQSGNLLFGKLNSSSGELTNTTTPFMLTSSTKPRVNRSTNKSTR